MRFKLLKAALTLGMVTSTPAQQNDHSAHAHGLSQPSDAQIVVTINPEARVSAVIGAPMPSPSSCGSPMTLYVKVINQGFVTAPLRAAIVNDDARQITLMTNDAKLSGAREDSRILRFLSSGSDPVDVTIAFSIDDTIGDLAGRDRVHVLLRCTQVRASGGDGTVQASRR